jgi:hypothetical protein
MTRLPLLCALLFGLAALVPAPAADVNDDGFVPMFNGRDLSGWVNVNCAPSTFFARDGEVITTGKPTGFLRTDRQYENFIAEFDWMHVNKTEVGNSGFFVWADPLPAVGTPYTRGIEVQVLVNLEYKDKKTGAVTATSHGDLFSIHGATCKPDRPHPLGWARCLPSENRAKGGGEWNHYKVVANDGTIKLHVNGKEVSGISQCRPRKGYLALESEGAECHFRNLRIKELPSTHPRPEEVAEEAKGFVNLYTGLDLSGWQADAGHKQHWQPHDSVLRYDGKGERADGHLRSEKEYGDYELMFDWRFPAKQANDAARERCGVILPGGETDLRVALPPAGNVEFENVTKGGGTFVSDLRDGTNQFKPRGQWNRLLVQKKGDEVSITLNGRLTKGAKLRDVPPSGPITLFAVGGPVEFENIFVRELKK